MGFAPGPPPPKPRVRPPAPPPKRCYGPGEVLTFLPEISPAIAKCAYCGLLGAPGRCEGCGAPYEFVASPRIASVGMVVDNPAPPMVLLKR